MSINKSLQQKNCITFVQVLQYYFIDTMNNSRRNSQIIVANTYFNSEIKHIYPVKHKIAQQEFPGLYEYVFGCMYNYILYNIFGFYATDRGL